MLATKNKLGRPPKHLFFVTLGVGEMAFVEEASVRSISSLVSYHNHKDDGKQWESLGWDEDGTRVTVGGRTGVYVRRTK